MDNQETVAEANELPNPVGNTVAGPEAGQQAAAKELPLQASGPVAAINPAVAASAVAAAQPVGVDPNGATVVPQSASASLSAADIDLIEKEWVDKAKAIVSATQGDPFRQNKEINKMKADYIKKRYNKDIKVASE